ncbi:MAG TPA: putative Fe-S cluster assembly protein SufT [Gammaproteobacteria bacterium]|nr:putative Fe-S cluster assembly protein SufT [Gammaproteobacteria bacterium]
MYNPQNEPVVFERDCDAVLIPLGEKLELPEGTTGFITQALGGSFTVYVEGNLFRIAGVDADAVGKEPIRPPEVPENATEQDIESVVWQQMRTCFDPEIPINIVELGLVYECEVTAQENGQRIVNVKMTLTAPGCGMGPVLMEDVREKLEIIPTVDRAEVELVFDPPWNQSMMSEAARLEAGLI